LGGIRKKLSGCTENIVVFTRKVDSYGVKVFWLRPCYFALSLSLGFLALVFLLPRRSDSALSCFG
jgi:hypothetical protein